MYASLFYTIITYKITVCKGDNEDQLYSFDTNSEVSDDDDDDDDDDGTRP
jgi:hypothetical protein